MTYYINPVWLYLINVSDRIHWLLLIFGIMAVFIGLIEINAYLIDDNDRKYVGLLGAVIAAGFLAVFASAFIPSKETCIEMIVASQVTKENVSGTREEIYQIIDYVSEKINGEESEE